MKRFDQVNATFKPKRTDDLKSGVKEWIGYRGTWEALWLIDDEDGGSYVGMYAMGIYDAIELEAPPPFVWVPECDLEIHSYDNVD
jgi:hypothetical protein